MTVKKDILCINEVNATFEGIEHHPCHFRTADCPDHCDHATDVAKFHIDSYIKYEKTGEYGDEKQEEFLWDLKPTADNNKLHPEYVEKVKELKPGQKAKIFWTHFYVHEDGNDYPERCVTYFRGAYT